MSIVTPKFSDRNLYVRFVQHLNENKGNLAATDGVYYDFLDTQKVLHQTLLFTVRLCKDLYPGLPYILHQDGRTSKTEGGHFYLTRNGGDIVCNLQPEQLPQCTEHDLMVERRKKYKADLERRKMEESLGIVSTQREDGQEWTKLEVINLLTTQAHLVGRMLGTGYDLLEPMHGEWIQQWLLNPQGFRVMIHQAHRDSYKSASLRLAVAIFAILEPLKTIIIIRKSEDAVKELINGISKILDTPLFHTFTHILYPDIRQKGGFKKVVDTALSIDTNLNVSLSGENQIRGFGLGSPLTGKHASKMVTDDICFIAGTKIATPLGDKNIEDLKAGDLVLTPLGARKINKTISRSADVITNIGLTGTSNHPVYNKTTNMFDFLCNSDYNNASTITLGDLERWQIAKMLLSGMVESGKKQEVSITSCGQLINTGLGKCFIEQYGNSTAGKFRQSMLYTIKTMTPKIIALKIWSVYRLANIKECMRLSEWNFPAKTCAKKQSPRKWSGLKQTKVRLFVQQILKSAMKFAKSDTSSRLSARSAELNIIQTQERQQDYAEHAENEQQAVGIGSERSLKTPRILAMLKSIAPIVDVVIKQILQPRQDAVKVAPKKSGIEKNERQLVYNLEVEDVSVYYANGILVHNCTTDDRESEASRRETLAKYREMMNLLSNNKGFSDTHIINIGTPWHEEDVFSLMAKGLTKKTERQEELEEILIKDRTAEQVEEIRQLNMKRGLFVYNCYQTGLMTQKDIEWKKQVLNDETLFAANYMLSLVSDEEKPFPKINNVGKYSKTFFGEAWEVFAAIDAAYEGVDSCTLGIGAFNWDTNESVVYGRLWAKVPLDQNYLELAEIMFGCGVQMLFMETNTDKGLMGAKFRELGFNVCGYHESQNKHVKIVSTIRPFWRDKGDEMLPCVQFVEETDEDYLAQIHNYKKGVKKDDAPDNLACLLQRSKFGALAIRVT